MKDERILLGHGSGGSLSHRLIKELFFPYLQNPFLQQQDDSAVLGQLEGEVVFTTDSYVVEPIFFPGGDIGKLAVCGTVNDLAMLGARAHYLSAGFILEEGLAVDQLEKILDSMRQAAAEAQIQIVTGDTKVVAHGAADKIFINTAGLGLRRPGIAVSGSNARAGDVIIINGNIAEHGIAVMASRAGLELNVELESDVAPLNLLVGDILNKVPDVHVLRDPTRGGLATTLNEIALQSQVGIRIFEKDLPVTAGVQGVCEILGLDPIYVANEGKFVLFCRPQQAEIILSILQMHPYGKEARVIGLVIDQPKGKVVMETLIGGQRMIDMLAGEQLPRIC
jgi:hydrogenase expression/formation protein HypE